MLEERELELLQLKRSVYALQDKDAKDHLYRIIRRHGRGIFEAEMRLRADEATIPSLDYTRIEKKDDGLEG